jgi:hypothetical protein
MVFFNYSTMQMAAKIVYYGPGLCGKTTNLQHIYRHTTQDSRGEMVSLETDTDRTLFFDLLPLDVGKIQGFNTRIQLYTVPGQVFYNTTRKLVLKGVDGVVFVADSQQPMLRANIESLNNLEENLQEIGLSTEAVPLVLQYNKRDLPDICSVAELDRELNRRGLPAFEAAAINGQGVFETLRAVSKLTLRALKDRLGKTSTTQTSVRRPVERAKPSGNTRETERPTFADSAAGIAATQAPAPPNAAAPQPAPAPAIAAPAPVAARIGPPTASPAPPPVASPAKPAAPAAAPSVGGRDILEELEKIKSAAAGKGKNGARKIDQNFAFSIGKDQLRQASHLRLRLAVEDRNRQVVDSFEQGFDVDDPATLEHLLLRLNIALEPRD